MDEINTDFTTFTVEELIEGVTVDESAGVVRFSKLTVSEGDEFYDPVEEQTFRVREVRRPLNNDVSTADIKVEYESGQRMELDEGAFAYGLTDGRSKQQIEILGRSEPDPWIVPIGKTEQS